MSLTKRITSIAKEKSIDINYVCHQAGYSYIWVMKRALRNEAISYKKLKKIAKALQTDLKDIV